MSIIGPILFATLMIAPAWLSQVEDKEEKTIAVADSSHLFFNQLPETDYLKFVYLPDANIDKYKTDFYKENYYAILYISQVVANSNNSVFLFSDKSPSLNIQMHIANAIEKRLENDKLAAYGIDQQVLKAVKTNVSVKSIKLDKTGEEQESNFTLMMVLGYLVGFIIYFAIFFSGSQVMRGVIEEKTNRIIEVIISSVKPFQLMMGKIMGVGLVALTQFAIWGFLTFAIYNAVAPMIMPDVSKMQKELHIQELSQTGSSMQTAQPVNDESGTEITEMFSSIKDIHFGVIIFSFLFFFFGGFFLYGSIFAAIGSAVDSESDTQQFMLPVTIPLILAMVVMINAIQNPESSIAFWFSIIPLTSPVVMMARIPFGVPYSQVFLSAGLLIITFVLFTWMAGKIYRTGILMYGKKSSWKEMWKWLRY